MLTASLNIRALKSVAFAAPNEETRYYLNGVSVEIGPMRSVYVATDGHILLCYHDAESTVGPEDKDGKHDDTPNTLCGRWIIPADILAKFKVGKKTSRFVTITLDGGKFRISNPDGDDFGFTPIDGTFPDWRRVLPQTSDFDGKDTHKDNDGFQLDGALVARADKAGAALSLGDARVMMRAGGPAVATFASDELFGVIMPKCVADRARGRRPSWIDRDAPDAPTATAKAA